MAQQTPNRGLWTWTLTDQWNLSQYNHNITTIDRALGPELGGIVPGDINGLSSSQIDELFPSAPPEGAIMIGKDGLSVYLLAKVDGDWYKTSMSAV